MTHLKLNHVKEIQQIEDLSILSRNFTILIGNNAKDGGLEFQRFKNEDTIPLNDANRNLQSMVRKFPTHRPQFIDKNSILFKSECNTIMAFKIFDTYTVEELFLLPPNDLYG